MQGSEAIRLWCADRMKECPICGNKVEDGEDCCDFCGYDFVNEESYDAYADEMDEEEEG